MHNLSMPFLYIDLSPVQLLIYDISYIEDMGRRGFRLSAPKDWVRRKYQQPGNLVIKISRCLADAVLFVAQVRLCDLKGWNLVHASVSEGVRMCKLDSKGQSTEVVMTLNIVDSRSTLLIKSKIEPIFSGKPITSIPELHSLLDELNTFTLCPGIETERFSSLIEKHNGTFHGTNGT